MNFCVQNCKKWKFELLTLLFWTKKITFSQFDCNKIKMYWKFRKIWIFQFRIGLLNSLKAKKALSRVTLHQKSPLFGVFSHFSAIFVTTSSLYLQICSWMITHSKNLVFKSWKISWNHRRLNQFYVKPKVICVRRDIQTVLPEEF